MNATVRIICCACLCACLSAWSQPAPRYEEGTVITSPAGRLISITGEEPPGPLPPSVPDNPSLPESGGLALAPGSLPEGLVLHLDFNQVDGATIPDPASGTVLASIQGQPAVVPALHGNGLRFDGSRDWLALTAVKDLALRGDVAIFVLARVPDLVKAGGFHMMVWRGDEQGGKDPYGLSFNNGRLLFRRDFPKTFEVAWPLAGFDLQDYHVFCGIHRSYEMILELWVDGRQVASTAVKGNFKYPTAGMATQIGAMDNGKSQFFNGVMDEVLIFRRALTPDEITTLSRQLLSRNP